MTHFPEDCLCISWVDREGAIFSSGFSFFGNLPLLLVLLLILQRFGRRQWGYIPELSTEGQPVLLHPIDANGALGKGKVPVNFYPEDMVHSGWSLLGRATTVVGANHHQQGGSTTTEGEHAKVPSHSSIGVSQGSNLDGAQRTQEVACNEHDSSTTTEGSEVDKLKHEDWDGFYQARDHYQRAYAQTVRSHDLVLKVSWPETSRGKEWEIIEHARALGKNDKFIKGHVPEVKCGRDFGRYSTSHIRWFLHLQKRGMSGPLHPLTRNPNNPGRSSTALRPRAYNDDEGVEP